MCRQRHEEDMTNDMSEHGKQTRDVRLGHDQCRNTQASVVGLFVEEEENFFGLG